MYCFNPFFFSLDHLMVIADYMQKEEKNTKLVVIMNNSFGMPILAQIL